MNEDLKASTASPEPQLHVSVDGIADGRKATVIVATARVGTETFVEAGAAVKDEHDEYQKEVGAKLALGRALRDLGRQLTRSAMREVR